MTHSAQELLDGIRTAIADGHGVNRFVPLVAEGRAPLASIGALAAEESRIVPADWRSFLALAARADDPAGRAFFTTLAQGEGSVLPLVAPLAAAAGFDEAAVRDHRPEPACQAYAAFVAWLASNAAPAVAAVALLTNFAAFGGYCAAIADGLRAHYGFADEAVAFFDFFAAPAPDLARQGLAAVQAGLDAGVPFDRAVEYARLLQGYELMFWNALADSAADPAEAG
ncbi:transcriptional regulator [Saccharothrix australiensis]|uniref:TENA/THI-4/PQQC family protein n=1 Tax=Saccharothrix australiensis TaxID=2072 RepID=A0A495W0K8_9PSEU|nr:transcriptional regulator [Saccharothrix australiensis]RKT54924.1 TENA/THI-4/PQQC family protein [Saccharothrix australiensis]